MRVQHSASIMSGGLLLGLLALLLLFTHAASGAPETASARIPNARGIFTGCYRVGTGDVRLIRGTLGCRPSERRVTWSRRGPIGLRGLQGPTGAQRATGERGETGPPGTQGLRVHRGREVLQGLSDRPVLPAPLDLTDL